MSGVGGEGRGLTLSTRAERATKGEESADRGSFLKPSLSTRSFNPSSSDEQTECRSP